jgi:hypothetical protein
LQRSLVKHKIIRELDQNAVAQKKRDKLLRPRFVNWKFLQHFFH